MELKERPKSGKLVKKKGNGGVRSQEVRKVRKMALKIVFKICRLPIFSSFGLSGLRAFRTSSILQHNKTCFMFDDAAYRIIQLIKIRARQLHLPVFVAVAVEGF